MSETQPSMGLRPDPLRGDGTDDELAALVALTTLPGLSPSRLWALLDLGTPTEVWQRVAAGRVPPSGRTDDPATRWVAHAATIVPAAVLEQHRSEGVDVLVHGSAAYPRRLVGDPEPPAVLFRRGSGASLDGVAVAIVGTRRCTHYGRGIAHDLGAALATRGIDVVSGLAHGIDASAHAGARVADAARCVGVVASGLDVVYPRGNRELWHAVADRGRLLGEWPLGSAPLPWRFPARNRLIAALSVAVVVVESGVRGGSMYTVDEAADRDRSVFAVPGSIRSPASAGTNRLLVEGAPALTSIDEFVEALAPAVGPDTAATGVADDHRGVAGSWLLDAIGWEPTSLEQVVAESGRDPADVVLEVERQIRAGTVHRAGVRLERLR